MAPFWSLLSPQHEVSESPQQESCPGTCVPAPTMRAAVTLPLGANLAARGVSIPPRLKPWTATPRVQSAEARAQSEERTVFEPEP